MKLLILHESKYEGTGSELGQVFHAGTTKIKKIDPKKIGNRDEGWYGAGFYVSTDYDYVKEWYGPTVTTFDVDPKAKILWASIDPKDAPVGLFRMVMENERKLLKNRGNEDRHKEISKLLKHNQIEWVHAIDRYAEAEKYDIVYFSPEEIVIKTISTVTTT